MLRSLKQARYAVEPLGHFALAFDQYTHFTSPIRRYPDLIVHRVLKWALRASRSCTRRARKPDPTTIAASSTAIALETSEAERRADGAERELMDWKTAQFMEQHLGEEYDALIISVQKFGFFVELMEIFVEGLVPINRLEEETGERCSIASATMPSSPAAAAARASGSWATACASAPTASTPCAAASNLPWPLGVRSFRVFAFLRQHAYSMTSGMAQ